METPNTETRTGNHDKYTATLDWAEIARQEAARKARRAAMAKAAKALRRERGK